MERSGFKMAKFNLDLSKIDWKKVIAVTGTIAMGVFTALSDYKEKQEMEDLKKTVKALQSKSEGS